MLHTVGGGTAPAGPVTVTHPAHWRQSSADALRSALTAVPEFARVPVVADSTAALTALQDDPGLPTRGAIALCDFGGTGTSITLVDPANGFAPIGATVRDTDLSGDLVDQALLTHVIDDLAAAGTIDVSGTSAIGSLAQLRAQCRGAKERLSTTSVTSLMAELPGHRSEVRLTRNELDEVLRQPLAAFVSVLQETLGRNGIGDLAAVATVGGGARIPLITTTLSEAFRVPVISSGQPELAAAIGGGLAAVRGTVEEGHTSLAAAAPAAAAAATQMAPEIPDDAGPQSSTFRALAWSDADDVPDVSPTDPYDYASPPQTADVRPAMQFHPDPEDEGAAPAPLPWYRRPEAALGAGVLVVLLALGAAVLYVMGSDAEPPAPASTTTSATTTAPPAPTSAAPPPPAATEAPETRTVTQQPAPPPVVTVTTQEPAPPPPTSEAPPPPPTTEAPPPPTTEAPPTTQSPQPLIPTLPYETIPGLPFVPNPIQPPPAQP
jgi:hypothetical protein